jgi:rod shape-determining protein MreD
MRLLPVAATAAVAALLELGVVPHLGVNDGHPHLVLVFGVIWATAAGADAGFVWAFVGGLALDVLALRPLGGSAVALLLTLGAVCVAARHLTRLRPVAPILLMPAVSAAYSLVLLAVLAVAGTSVGPDATGGLLAAAVYDTALVALLGPFAIVLHDRRVVAEPAYL